MDHELAGAGLDAERDLQSVGRPLDAAHADQAAVAAVLEKEHVLAQQAPTHAGRGRHGGQPVEHQGAGIVDERRDL